MCTGRVGAVNFEMAYSSPFSEIGAMQQNHLQRVGASREMRLWCEEAYTSFCHARNRVALHGSTVDALLFAARRMDFVFHKAVLADEMSDLYDAVVRDDDRGICGQHGAVRPGYALCQPPRLAQGYDQGTQTVSSGPVACGEPSDPLGTVVAVRYDRMLLEWETQYDRIQLDLQQQARTGMHLPREQVGFRFDRPKS